MKNNHFIIGLVALLAVGCSPSADNIKSNSATVKKQMAETQEAAHEVAMDLKSYTYEKKADFVTAMNKQLAELDADIEELSAKVEKSSDKVKAEAAPKLEALKLQAAALKKRIASVAQATPSTWTNIKTESSAAYQTLKDGVTQSRQWLADKIAP